jgi:hypothetical protein
MGVVTYYYTLQEDNGDSDEVGASALLWPGISWSLHV